MVEMLFQHLAKNWPADTFIFMVGKNSTGEIKFPANINTVFLANPSDNPLILKLWYDYKLPSLLKKEKIDILINTYWACSLRTSVPQLLLVKNMFFYEAGNKISANQFIKKRFEKSLLKASAVFVFNPSGKSKLQEAYPLLAEKITTANFFANPGLRPMHWQEKERIKEKYSEGKEFFLFVLKDNSVDVLVVLKAFSLFKKRQQSNMQLLMVGDIAKYAKNIHAKLATYKYRSEVKMLNDMPTNEMSSLLSATYCQLHYSMVEIDLQLLNAMQVGVPSIILGKGISAEMPTDIALYADGNNPDAIAEQMKIIYKDENLRGRIIAAGLQTAAANTLEKSSAQVWSAIEEVVKKSGLGLGNW